MLNMVFLIGYWLDSSSVGCVSFVRNIPSAPPILDENKNLVQECKDLTAEYDDHN